MAANHKLTIVYPEQLNKRNQVRTTTWCWDCQPLARLPAPVAGRYTL